MFWVSVPFGLAGVVFGWLVLPQTIQSGESKQFDRWGAVLLSAALAALVISLSELETWQPETVMLTCLWPPSCCPICMERTLTREPANRSQALSCCSLPGGSYWGKRVLRAPLRNVFHHVVCFCARFSSIDGLCRPSSSTIPIMISITAPISGRLYEKFGSRILTPVGMALCSVAIVFLAKRQDGMDPGSLQAPEHLRYLALGLASTSRQIMQLRWRQLLTDETPRPEDC